jgi:hypothetical protein
MNKVKEFEVSRKIESKDEIPQGVKALWDKIQAWVATNPVEVVGEPRPMVITNRPPWLWIVAHVEYEDAL